MWPEATGAWPYNRPCAQQYVGKYQSCMVISGRLIVHAPVSGTTYFAAPHPPILCALTGRPEGNQAEQLICLSLLPSLGNTYEEVWTLKDGTSEIENHEYKLFRWAVLNVTNPSGGPPPAGMKLDLSAWVVRYPWSEAAADLGSFNSSNPMLNKVPSHSDTVYSTIM